MMRKRMMKKWRNNNNLQLKRRIMSQIKINMESFIRNNLNRICHQIIIAQKVMKTRRIILSKEIATVIVVAVANSKN
jgi:hypothetical protein